MDYCPQGHRLQILVTDYRVPAASRQVSARVVVVDWYEVVCDVCSTQLPDGHAYDGCGEESCWFAICTECNGRTAAPPRTRPRR